MKAKFSSSCKSCGELIKVGKDIAKDNSGQWLHKHCVEEAIGLPCFFFSKIKKTYINAI